MIKTQIIDSDLKNQIELFYKISLFLSKFWIVLLAFILSIFVTFSFLHNSQENILNYSSNISVASTNIDSLQQDFIWVQNPDSLTKKLKYLEANYILSKSSVDKIKVKLWWWLYTTPTDMQFPSFLSLNIRNLKYLSWTNFKKVLNNYYAVITKSSYYSPNVKIKFSDDKWLSLINMKKQYNLSCIDYALTSKTLFCKINKAIMLNDLVKWNIEISKNAYNVLFDSLEFSNSQKCSLLKKIYSNKLNYDNIINVAEKYCEDVDDFNIVKDIVNNFRWLFLPSDLLTIEWKYHKLVNQWVYLLKSNNLSADNIVSHIDYVKNLMDSDLLSKWYLYIEYKVLNHLKTRVLWNDNLLDVMSKIDKLINWDKITFQKWIKSFLWDLIDKKQEKNNSVKLVRYVIVKSVRERFLDLIRKDYKKYFIPIEKISFKDNTAYLNWNLYLMIWGNKNEKVYKLLVYLIVDLNSLIWSKFTIKEVSILDDWVKNYLDAQWISIPKNKDLIYLQSYFSDALADYYLNNWKNVSISFCDKVRKKWFKNCFDNTITLNEKNWKLNVKFVFKDDILSKVILPNDVKYEIAEDWLLWKEEFKINLEKLSEKLNKMIQKKDYTLVDIRKIYSLIERFVDKKKNEYIQKLVWLPPKDIIKLQSLFKQYLWVNINKIRHISWTKYYIYFSVSGYNVRVVYDYSSNKIVKVEVFDKKNKTFIDFWPVSLIMWDLSFEKLNLFSQETEDFLKWLNKKAYNKLKD